MLEHPFQISLGATSTPLNSMHVARATFQVPHGKHLILEYVSAIVSVTAGKKVVDFSVATTVGQRGVVHHIVPSMTGHNSNDGLDLASCGQVVKLYADPNSQVEFVAFSEGALAHVDAFFSGCLIDR